MKSKNEVMETARGMVREAGLINLSRSALCERAGIADGSFPHVMGCTFGELQQALRTENLIQPVAPVSKSRVPAGLRKEHILAIAVEQAKTTGYTKITRDGIAEAAGVSFGLVTKYFGTMGQLRTDIIRYAEKNEVLEIIAQCVVNQHPRAKKIPNDLKQRALKSLSA